MSELTSKPRPRRSKSGAWPKWLRNARLLKWTFCIGVAAYRLWRLWRFLRGPTDG